MTSSPTEPTGVKEWIEHALNDAGAAEKYANALAAAGYTKVSEIRSISRETLKDVGVTNLRHVDLIMEAKAPPPGLQLGPNSATLSRKDYINQVKKYAPAPSSYSRANDDNGWTTKQNKYRIDCHKPLGYDGFPKQVVLLNNVLAELYMNLNGDYEPSREDCKSAQLLMELGATPFKSEAALTAAFYEWMEGQLNYSIPPQQMDGSKSDGTIEISTNELFHHAKVMVAQKEDKMAKGEGRGDSYMQNIGYYSLYWSNAREEVRQSCVCPSILIEQAGHDITISGCVLGQRITCDPFFVLNILPVPHDRNHKTRVARMVGSLACAIKSLIKFYQDLKPSSVADAFPQFRQFEDTQLTYSEHLSGLVFKAKAVTGANTKDVIVKFCHSYSKEAHNICEVKGAAPTLLYYGKWAYFTVVVTEFVVGSETLHTLRHDNESIVQEVKGQVVEVIQALHDKGYVHGDIRANNILVQTTGEKRKIYLIDFDWAGCADSDKYPLFMNHQGITWPNGAEDGKKLQKSHDLEWIARDFK